MSITEISIDVDICGFNCAKIGQYISGKHSESNLIFLLICKIHSYNDIINHYLIKI